MKKILYGLIIVCTLASCGSRRGGSLHHPDYHRRPQAPATKKHTSNTPPQSGLNYIERYKHIAISEMERYGIPASIKLAQALLESGNGNSYLATRANNHFGIKCGGGWKGRTIRRADDRPDDCFRVYDNPEQSFHDHSLFLMRSRYERLFSLNKNDYKGWAYGLKAAGYATNPRYPELLISLIERYQLYQYDRSDNYVEKEKREERVETIIEEKQVEEEVIQPEKVKNPVAMIIYEVKPGDTLNSISRAHDISVQDIININGLSGDSLHIGQLLVLSK